MDLTQVNMEKAKILLNRDWLYRHRDDEVAPIKFLKENIINGKSIRYVSHSFNYLTIEYDDSVYDEDSLSKYVCVVLEEAYDEDDVDFAKVVTIEDYSQKAVRRRLIEERLNRELEYKKKLEDDLNVVNNLVGADEIKSLAKEIAKIAPGMRARSTMDAFTYQSYLFSVGEGMGMTTYAHYLSKIIADSRLAPVAEKHIEGRVGAVKDSRNEDAAFDEIFETLKNNGEPDCMSVFVIDISACMDKVGSEKFRKFLKDALKHASEFIYVFRIPYVEKDVLDRVREALSDVLTIKTISIPPIGNDDVKLFAKRELEKYALTFTPGATNFFMQRISEEKSDGKFYGFNTIKKVVRELVYNKECYFAKYGGASKSITVADAKAICAHKQESKRGFDQLDALIGCEPVKKQIELVLAQIKLARKENIEKPCMHMRFVGNPGTGKTTVARILGRIFKEKGVLRIGNFFEYSSRDFCGIYIGETAPKTAGMCRDAYGSVLFIDEAYSLYRSSDNNSKDFGREAIDTLIAEMENHKDDLVVIMAGYPDDMDKLMEGNQGLKSRIPYTIEFSNFTRAELYDIYMYMIKGKFAYDEKLCDAVRKYFDELPDEIYNAKEFGNARFVRNLFERTWAKACLRCELEKKNTVKLTASDFESATSDKEFSFNEKKKTRMGFFEKV